MPKTLTFNQRRVLGVLIEKAKTTPAGYPMSVNAIVTGSNQKSNRDPVTTLDEADVMNALNDLDNLGLVEVIDWTGRVVKYKHQAYEWFSVGTAELAVLAELLLRGPQQLGELRARAARMAPIKDLTELKPIVDGLVERGLMLELTPAGRGQMVTHNLYPDDELAEVREGLAGSPTGPAPAPRSGGGASELSELQEEIAALRERVDALEKRLDPRADH